MELDIAHYPLTEIIKNALKRNLQDRRHTSRHMNRLQQE